MTEDNVGTLESLAKMGAPKLSWLEQANAEIAELQEAARANPKEFYGNKASGMGTGLSRVRALLYASKTIDQALGALNRGM